MGESVENPRKKALKVLRAYVVEKMDPMGIVDNYVELPPGPVTDLTSVNGGINASDIWASNLADTQNDAMKAEVNSLASAFRAIVEAIDSECLSMDDMVDSESDEAKWLNA